MNLIMRLFSEYKSEAQMRRQAIEWVVRLNGGARLDALDVEYQANMLLHYWINGTTQ